MNFLLKIVEGPNKGAEIALVDGVAVTLGKGDECDIVIADPTMPDAPVSLEATADGVTADGEPVEHFYVKTLGATSFAVGPADAPWGPLKWPKAEAGEPGTGGGEKGTAEPGTASGEGGDAPSGGEPPPEDGAPAKPEKGRGGCCGCLVAAFSALLVVAGLAWFFRDRLRESGCIDGIRDSHWTKKIVAVSRDGYARTSELIATWRAEEPQTTDPGPAQTLQDVAEKYGLSFSDEGGVAKVSGNLKTRRERLAATAEAYAAQAGAEIDLSDDESLRTSAEDALFTLTEGALKVSAATNRVLRIVGHAASAHALTRVLEALNGDMPKLRGVDVSGVAFTGLAAGGQAERGQEGAAAPPLAAVLSARRGKKASSYSLPVCGIMTAPYPCIVTRDGRRYLEGAAIGDCVILKIDADSVVLTNSTGRFTWKP